MIGIFQALFLFSAVVTAWAGYSSSKANNGYGYVLSNSRPYYTYKPYVITPTAVKPVYVAKPYYGYGNGYGYGQLHQDSYRPIWSSSNTADSYYPYYGYAGSYLYNPYYYGSYKHGIGYYPGYGYGDWK
ncbi:hypothetical protein TNIN_384891 [Trichonephila inaurata madagascariensis]|uniref:Prisilkin-39-like n=1 Tax=Trichonephila inaurata madagascariensis TaxID=2747483 RepID=A0A8X6Y0T5_9ARAC|nr:hypothetical protein TNIN_384891 [Trichonephila inaurata madagascariensis]